jgi:Cadherin-like
LPVILVQRNEDDGAVTVNGFATNIARGPASATDETAQTLTFFVSVTGTTGSLAFATAPVIDSTSGALTFTLTSNTSGSASVQVILQDNGSGTPPNVNSSAAQTFTIEVAAVNDEQVLATNNGLTLGRGANGAIAASLLETTDIDDVPADLVYTVTSGPTHGTLLVSGSPVAQFTQQQINSGLVSYQHNGTATLSDSFGFTVDDGEGTASSATFAITIQPFAGDYNGNSTVDAGDYVLWRKSLGTTVPQPYAGSDGDGNTIIEAYDYTVWRSNFGNSLSPASGSGARVWMTTTEVADSESQSGRVADDSESNAAAADRAIELLVVTQWSGSSSQDGVSGDSTSASEGESTENSDSGSGLSAVWKGV